MDPVVIQRLVLTLVTLILSITVHEYAHALAAFKLGDDYAAREGRLTLNPLAHADPIGTVMLPAMFSLLGGGLFGWGRPVPYIPTHLTRRFSMRAGEAIIAFAGPFANLIMAVICGGLYVGLYTYGVIGPASPFVVLLSTMVHLNVVLFFFNLLPVPPLDGSKIVSWIFGIRADRPLDAVARAGYLPLLLVVGVGGSIIAWPVSFVVNAIFSGFIGILG